MIEIQVPTAARQEMVNVTGRVQAEVAASGVKEGICLVYVSHTTAGIVINEGADPSVQGDILMALDNIVSDQWPYRHAEGNSPAHVKSCLTGSSVSLPVSGGRLVLGTWQAVFFCEFDGPRQRKIKIAVLDRG